MRAPLQQLLPRNALSCCRLSLKRSRTIATVVAVVIVTTLPGSAAPPEVTDLPKPASTTPAQAAANCVLRPGFHIELVASEPEVVDPVAMAFDEAGRLYVVEMRDYPEQREEKLGRIKLLEDTDGDGRYDRSSIFAENLPWPTSVTCWDGGIFVTAVPEVLYFKDTDGDRRADVHATVFTGFGNLADKLNVQALPNSLQWGPDQRIHGALGGNPSRVENFALHGSPKIELRGRDFSFDPQRMDFRPETGGGQWGLTFDDAGRKFVCTNSRHIMQVLYNQRFAAESKVPLPAAAVDIAVDGPQAPVYRLSPDEAWRVLRTEWRAKGIVKGLVEGGGRPSGYFTSACGITIYRGDAFPAEYQGNAFIGDCGSNLVHRKKLRANGATLVAERAAGEETTEFLASRDNWFRPVSFANAPDGCLWICDMARETVEHPWSLPDTLRAKLDLKSNQRGRIWRVVPDNFTPRPAPNLGAASDEELLALLDHPNGWHRDTAARLLHQRGVSSPVLSAKLAARVPPNVVPESRKSAAVVFTPPAATGTRQEAFARLQASLALKGSGAAGRTIFEQRCAACHRVGNLGNAVGPDLNAAAQAGREKLLGNIVDPSREITAGFTQAIVSTKSGEIVAGILSNETPAGVILRVPGGGDRAIARAEISKLDRPATSLMPEGLETGLSDQQMADLLEFLSAPAP